MFLLLGGRIFFDLDHITRCPLPALSGRYREKSAIGPKRTFHYVAFNVAFGGKADMAFCGANVRL
jgi:hypothetical protein